MTTITAIHVNAWTWVAFFVTWNTTAFFTNKTRWHQPKFQLLQHGLLMFAGFWLIFRGFFHHNDVAAMVWGGDVMTIAGIAFAAWARWHLGRYWSGHVTLKEDHRLIRSGPYRLARHPLYTGFLTAVLGSAITAGTWYSFIGFALVTAGIMIKIYREEALLGGEFGEEYARFKREKPALIPLIY
jgi:protein-S-isoprenylcysteine O-methyltransferase Ste14